MTITTAEPYTAHLERVRFFPRQLIGADDLNQDQSYHRQKRRLHNRYLHGWGVVCGCDVRPMKDPKKPWEVCICPGYVLTPQGDEILVSNNVAFDVATCLTETADPCAFSRPCPPVTRRAMNSRTLYLAVRYVECSARPVRVAPVGCSCDDVDCEYSRIRDGYEFCCLSALPASHERTTVDCAGLCAPEAVLPCAECPEDPWVVLATLMLPDSDTLPFTLTDIDPLADRKLLYSTSALQDLGLCHCEETS